MKHIRLFEPIRINRLAVGNRTVMPAMGLHFTDDYTFNDRYSAFYRRRAHGGVGLMIVGPLAIDLVGGAPVMPGLFDDSNMQTIQALNTELHRDTKAKLGVQLFHMGRNAPARLFTGEPALAPSAVRSRLTGDVPKAMTEEDIDRVQVSFVRAAERAVAAGFDFIEIIACTGYLISQFLSPLTNLRTDGYGGSWENRMRFGLETIRRVRAAIGPDVALGIRVAGNDFMEGSNTNDESALFCAEAEKAGVDAINVTGGWHETLVPQLTQAVPPGAYAYLARGIRDKVSIPVFASNRLGDPDVAERVLRSGAADMICWGRPLIAEPDLPRKVREGRIDEIIRCVSCNQGCFDSIFLGRGIFCAVNPTVGREGAAVPAADSSQCRKVFVAGGGPAGMQFALTASELGHAVTLFEKEKNLGGQIPVAAGPPAKGELLHIRDGMVGRLLKRNVEIRCGRPLTVDDVKRGRPDVVVVATGAQPIAIRVPGSDKPHVVDAWDILRGDVAHIGKKVVIVGGNAVGCETAEWIATDGLPDPETFMFLSCHGAEKSEKLKTLGICNGRRITVIDMVDRIGANVGPSTRWVLMQSLKKHEVQLRTGTRLVEIGDDAVVVETDAGRERIEADTVVMAVGSRSVNDLVEDLRPLGVEVLVIGDAKTPRKFSDAIAEGYEEALGI
jgi:2,4-dienoyl-CoA reductase (NADPH2)